MGGKAFGARQYASNFDREELTRAVYFAHMHRVRLYITVNTLVDDAEMPELADYLLFLNNVGVDGIIVQDMGVINLARKLVPQLPLHASTQMTVTSLAGVRLCAENGMERAVLARELSIKDIKTICNSTDTEIEVFIHGALCVCYSGQCLMSSLIGGRSGNRGLCAQPCRLDWRCGKGDHVLSLKDMSLLRHAQEMADAGITTLKIEGRMKRPEYVAAVVTACREALALEPYDEDTLRAVFSRSGFTDGYLTGRRDKTMFGYRTKDDVQSADKVLKSLAALYEKETPRVGVSMAFSLTETESALTVSDGENARTVTGDAPEKAEKSGSSVGRVLLLTLLPLLLIAAAVVVLLLVRKKKARQD